MNILYISKLTGNKWAGPSVCVPQIVHNQAKLDNVFWYNLNTVEKDEWSDFNGTYANLRDIPSERLRDLPSPFNNPDIAIIEEVYAFPFCKLVVDLQRDNIPYVVVPHSQLTRMGQKQKFIKKTIGNLLFFNKMLKKAVSVQYLSVGEMASSVNQWGKKGYIVPNGVEIPTIVHKNYHDDKKICSYIGRIDMYQKGLDLLVEAIKEEKELLIKNNFEFHIYGPNNDNAHLKLQHLINSKNLNDVIFIHGPVFGSEKEEVLINTDAFVMTSRFEGHSLGLIEALSYQIPCIASEGTYMTSEISRFNAGWVCSTDVVGIVAAIKRMVEDKGCFAEMGRNAKRLAETYSWDNITQRNHCKYKEIIEKRG